MAGIVASTLRRKAFHKKPQGDSRFAVPDPGHVTSSPTTSLAPSISPSQSGVEPAEPRVHGQRVYPPKATKLQYRDFWPNCVNPAEPSLKLINFETFETLIPKANAWLLDNVNVRLLKCETVEKKSSSVEHVFSNNIMFIPTTRQAIYVKGLRLWFVYNQIAADSEAALNTVPVEIGYMNVIPKCVDRTSKYPVYENLPDTYASVNAYLAEAPLEGKIVTIETVPLKLTRCQWKNASINPDQTCFVDEFQRHTLYITRIYFRYGAPEEEFIGAQDFLPDADNSTQWRGVYGVCPKYCPFSSTLRKAKDWMKAARHITITNIQTLDAVYRKNAVHVHTGVNFIEKTESCLLVRFVRITYIRPGADSVLCRLMYSAPSGLSYKTFTPAPVKVAMCSGAPEYEPFTSTWERAKTWLSCVNRRVVSVESFSHPLTLVWNRQDSGETTLMRGEWTGNDRSDRHRHGHRRCLVQVVRVYLDGDYQEPAYHQLPPPPAVEEINDCKCVLQ